jgi:hypothetical protein
VSYVAAVTKLLFPLLALSLAVGCHRDHEAEGPVERAGKHVDNAAEKTGSALERAAQKTDAAAHKAVQATGEAFEKAGAKLKGTPSATPASSSAPAPRATKPQE